MKIGTLRENKHTLMELGLWGLSGTAFEQHLWLWWCNPIELKCLENLKNKGCCDLVALVDDSLAEFKVGIVEGTRCEVGESESSIRSWAQQTRKHSNFQTQHKAKKCV